MNDVVWIQLHDTGRGMDPLHPVVQDQVVSVLGPTATALATKTIRRFSGINDVPMPVSDDQLAGSVGVPPHIATKALKRLEKYQCAQHVNGVWVFERRWPESLTLHGRACVEVRVLAPSEEVSA